MIETKFQQTLGSRQVNLLTVRPIGRWNVVTTGNHVCEEGGHVWKWQRFEVQAVKTKRLLDKVLARDESLVCFVVIAKSE